MSGRADVDGNEALSEEEVQCAETTLKVLRWWRGSESAKKGARISFHYIVCRSSWREGRSGRFWVRRRSFLVEGEIDFVCPFVVVLGAGCIFGTIESIRTFFSADGGDSERPTWTNKVCCSFVVWKRRRSVLFSGVEARFVGHVRRRTVS